MLISLIHLTGYRVNWILPFGHYVIPFVLAMRNNTEEYIFNLTRLNFLLSRKMISNLGNFFLKDRHCRTSNFYYNN